jgi:hypothetical protein
LIGCNQRKCQWVAQDLANGGKLVCSAPDNQMIRVATGRSFILSCSAYRRRPEWNGNFPDRGIPALTGTVDIDKDGLYPGQIRPQLDPWSCDCGLEICPVCNPPDDPEECDT